MEKNQGSTRHKLQLVKFVKKHMGFVHNVQVTLLAFFIVAFFALITLWVKPLDPLSNAVKEFSFTDIYYSVLSMGSPDTCRFITIVDMTEVKNRGDVAKVIDDIEACHPKVLGVDCVFEIENLYSPEVNDSVIQVADKYKNIIWATELFDYSTESDSIGYTRMQSSFFKKYTNITEGYINIPRGSMTDAMKREIPIYTHLNRKKINSFCAKVSDAYANEKLSSKYNELIKINYTPTYFHSILPSEIAKNKDLIEGQIILLGDMNNSNDMHWTPVGRIPGLEVLAFGIQSIINGKVIRSANTFELCIISFLIVLLVQFLQVKYLKATGSSKNIFIRFVLGSTYIMSILTFLFTSIFILVGLFVFTIFHVSYSLGWSLSVVAFLGTSRNMYTALKEYFTNKIDKK